VRRFLKPLSCWRVVMVAVLVAALGPVCAAGENKDTRWAVLVHYAGGLKDVLLKKYDFAEDHVLVSSDNADEVRKALEKVKEGATEDSLILVASCGHTQKGALILTLPLTDVEKTLKDTKGTKVVLQSTCHSGLAIKALESAQVVYAACKADEFEGGVFFSLFAEAVSDEKKADADKDGKVSLGEAYEYASENERIQAGYKKLYEANPAFWPAPSGPLPLKKKNDVDLDLWLGKEWKIPREDTSSDGTVEQDTAPQ